MVFTLLGIDEKGNKEINVDFYAPKRMRKVDFNKPYDGANIVDLGVLALPERSGK